MDNTQKALSECNSSIKFNEAIAVVNSLNVDLYIEYLIWHPSYKDYIIKCDENETLSRLYQ